MENCGSCKYFSRFKEDADLGRCRRYPPSIEPSTATNGFSDVEDVLRIEILYDMTAYPVVSVAGWCGEWKP
jgi:hypothetical protein